MAVCVCACASRAVDRISLALSLISRARALSLLSMYLLYNSEAIGQLTDKGAAMGKRSDRYAMVLDNQMRVEVVLKVRPLPLCLCGCVPACLPAGG